MTSLYFYFFLCLHYFVCYSSEIEPVPHGIVGYRLEPTHGKTLPKIDFEPTYGAYRLPRGQEVRLRLYGLNMSLYNSIAFTRRASSFGSTDNSTGGITYCDKLGHSRAYTLTPDITNPGEPPLSAVATIYFDTDSSANDVLYFFCLEHNASDEYVHQGANLSILVYHLQPYVLPLPLQLCMICFCLTLSWLFSGLNLGLMSLDCTELQLITRCGSEDDRRFARALEPIRRRGNTLLCTILLTNTIVNSGYTLLLDDLVGEGIYALIGSTVGIVIFGEILPQAVCSRYGLKVGYYTRWIVQFFMYALYPLTFSLGKLLDLVFGQEIHQVYSRDKLREIVMISCQDTDGSISAGGDVAGHLRPEEVKIVTGALQMTEKTVRDIMKGRSEIFMLDINECIDYDLIARIARNGYTRIPIYANGDRDYIVGLLNAKDLLGIDPEDKLPLNSLIEFYGREVIRVEEDRTILSMLNTFKEAKVHLAIVDHVDAGSEDHDPSRTIVGVVTLEDVIEFILRDEIVDETDVLKEVLRNEEQMERAIGVKSTGHRTGFMSDRSEIIPLQLCTAATQFLMANVEPFRKEIVERKVLARLLRFPGLFVIKKYQPEHQSENLLFSYDQPADFFALILQGSCHVYIGKEQLPFEAGPFHFFGLEALVVPYDSVSREVQEGATPGSGSRQRSDSLTSISPAYSADLSVFRPDFTVEITSDIQYIRLTLAMYRALIGVTRLARFCDRADDSVFVVDKLRIEMQQHNGVVAQTPSTVHSSATLAATTLRQNSVGTSTIPSTASLLRLANLKALGATGPRNSIAIATPDRQFSCVEFIKPARPANNGSRESVHSRSGSLVGINRYFSEMPTTNNTRPPLFVSKRFQSKTHLQSNEDISLTANDNSQNHRAVPGNHSNGASFLVGSSRSSLSRAGSTQPGDALLPPLGVETVPREVHHHHHGTAGHRSNGSCESLPTSPMGRTSPNQRGNQRFMLSPQSMLLETARTEEQQNNNGSTTTATLSPTATYCSSANGRANGHGRSKDYNAVEKNGDTMPLLVIRQPSDEIHEDADTTFTEKQQRRRNKKQQGNGHASNNGNNGNEKQQRLRVPANYFAADSNNNNDSSATSSDQIVSDDSISLDFHSVSGSFANHL